MASKQASALKAKVLKKFPKGTKIKHYRFGILNAQETCVEVVSPSGDVVKRAKDWSLEQALQKLLGDK